MGGGDLFGDPYIKDYSILGSILGSPYLGKLANESCFSGGPAGIYGFRFATMSWETAEYV